MWHLGLAFLSNMVIQAWLVGYVGALSGFFIFWHHQLQPALCGLQANVNLPYAHSRSTHPR